MKTKLGMAVGLGVGTMLYETFRHGPDGIDWFRAGFVTLFAGIVFLVLPNRWFEKKEA